MGTALSAQAHPIHPACSKIACFHVMLLPATGRQGCTHHGTSCTPRAAESCGVPWTVKVCPQLLDGVLRACMVHGMRAEGGACGLIPSPSLMQGIETICSCAVVLLHAVTRCVRVRDHEWWKEDVCALLARHVLRQHENLAGFGGISPSRACRGGARCGAPGCSR